MSSPPRLPPDLHETSIAATMMQRRFGRRSLLATLGAFGAVGAAGALASVRFFGRRGQPSLKPTATSASAAGETATTAPPATASGQGQGQGGTSAATTSNLVAPRAVDVLQTASRPVIADGLALVTSPRLPLFGVGPDDPARLLSGELADWSDAGSAIRLPVQTLALEGQVPDGVTPAETYADYDALVAGLAEQPGGVAAVPLDQVDFRVNVLAVGGVDPLRDGNDEIVRIGVVGDIVPGRNVHNKMVEYGDFSHPFRKIADQLAAFDLTFANLEGNLSDTIAPPEDPHTFSFVSDPAMAEGLKFAGIDAVSLANNHSTWNSAGWGVDALLDTLDALDAAGVASFGAGRDLAQARAPWVSEVKGLTIAVLGIDGVTANREQQDAAVVAGDVSASDDSAGTNPFATDLFVADIEAAANEYDVVIPYFHMGQEYTVVPPDWCLQGARAAIDAGAALVVTNHPHIIQGMEIYKNTPIVYSVGNFIFDQMFSVEVRQGLILEITLRGRDVVGIRFRGVEIEDFNQPRLMSGAEHAAIMDRFWRGSDRIAARS